MKYANRQKTEQKIMHYLINHGMATATQIAKGCGISENAARLRIKTLMAEGAIARAPYTDPETHPGRATLYERRL